MRIRKMSDISEYREDLLAGSALLVINPVNGKGSSYDSSDDSINYKLYFNVTHPQFQFSSTSGYRRYRYECARSLYKEASEGDEFYLILWPGGNVRACFPCSTTILPPDFAPVLKRDFAHTGVSRSLSEEYHDMNSQLNERMLRNKTPEERNAWEERIETQRIFASITNPVLRKIALWFMLPLILIGSVLCCTKYIIWGFVSISIGSMSIILSAIIMLIFKAPLVAWKRKKDTTSKE